MFRKTLGELRPDITTPEFMTDTERHLWAIFFEKNPDILKLRL